MGRCKRNKKNRAREEMQEGTSPGPISQQNGEIEVNATGPVGSHEPPECCAFSVRMTKERVATSHSSHSVSHDSAPPYDSWT